MKKMSKKKKTILIIVAVIVVIGLFSSLGKEDETEMESSTAPTTESANEIVEEPKDSAKEKLDTCCKTIAENLNTTKYNENGFNIYGQAYNEQSVIFSVDMPYTTEEITNLYAKDKQSLRDLWGSIARETWNYLLEQGYEAPADIDVSVFVYASDNNKKSVIHLTKHDTKLQD